MRVHRFRIVLIAVICSITLCIAVAPCAFASVADDHVVSWPGNFNLEGNNQTTASNLPDDRDTASLAWKTHVGNGTVCIVDGYVYTYNGTSLSGSTDNSGTMSKLDSETGEVVSSFTVDASCGYYYAYVAYGQGMLYVACQSCVFAVDLSSFSLSWISAVPSKEYCPVQYIDGYVVTNGTVLSADTGQLVKTLPGSYLYSSGACDGSYFYVASAEGKVYSFDISTWALCDTLATGQTSSYRSLGLCCSNGTLYWAGNNSGKIYSVRTGEGGDILEDTLLSADTGLETVCTPVVAGGRVYLAGSIAGTESAGQGAVCVLDSVSLNLAYTARYASGAGKIQSTPIVKVDSGGGNVVTSEGALQCLESLQSTALAEVGASMTVYVQDYASPSKILMLKDSPTSTSGELEFLANVQPSNYAYEQIACDDAGGLYCVNDSGYLNKLVSLSPQAPIIVKDLSTDELFYVKGSAADALSVEVSAPEQGRSQISYQWQSRVSRGSWEAIPGATSSSYTPSTQTTGTVYYQCVVTNTLLGQIAQVKSKIAKVSVTAVTVQPGSKGDVNSDGSADAVDVAYLKRALVGVTGYAVFEEQADVNGDGHINGLDVTYLKRALAGWSGYEL